MGSVQLSMFVPLSPSRNIPYCETWDFNGVDTQYGVHGIHTYLAAMIPQLARRLIEMYVPPRGVILDPFCGGGSVLAEAIMAGREAVGIDVNELGVLISRAKTTYINPDKARLTLQNILNEASSYNGPSIGFKRLDNIHFWFKEYMLQPLTALRCAIDHILPKESKLRTLFMVIFSATVRDVSLTRRNEIRLRRMPICLVSKLGHCKLPLLMFWPDVQH